MGGCRPLFSRSGGGPRSRALEQLAASAGVRPSRQLRDARRQRRLDVEGLPGQRTVQDLGLLEELADSEERGHGRRVPVRQADQGSDGCADVARGRDQADAVGRQHLGTQLAGGDSQSPSRKAKAATQILLLLWTQVQRHRRQGRRGHAEARDGQRLRASGSAGSRAQRRRGVERADQLGGGDPSRRSDRRPAAKGHDQVEVQIHEAGPTARPQAAIQLPALGDHGGQAPEVDPDRSTSFRLCCLPASPA
mmetsp:Transcript_15456/g.54143  ORF Transcript_15456/g.54143 Transcript_15456/m.54143 type:complete len:250 (-) Transcript_15456:779-1528(-)